jgi:hypothetical protein
MFVYMYVRVCTYVCTMCIYLCMYVRVYERIYVCMYFPDVRDGYACVCTSICMNGHVRMWVGIETLKYVRLACMYICMFVRM